MLTWVENICQSHSCWLIVSFNWYEFQWRYIKTIVVFNLCLNLSLRHSYVLHSRRQLCTYRSTWKLGNEMIKVAILRKQSTSHTIDPYKGFLLHQIIKHWLLMIINTTILEVLLRCKNSNSCLEYQKLKGYPAS